MRTDMTIYVEGLLLERGGLVVVLPTEVPVTQWRENQGLPNPATNDPRLNAVKPIDADDRRLSVRLASTVGVVEFEFPEGGSFNFRFLPLPDSGVPVERVGSQQLSVGNANDRHPVTGEIKSRPRVQDIMVVGPEINEQSARALGTKVRTGFLNERYACVQFEHALACDATEDRLGG